MWKQYRMPLAEPKRNQGKHPFSLVGFVDLKLTKLSLDFRETRQVHGGLPSPT
jgi:hypothetical protein